MRYFGGWSNTRQAAYMARCNELLQASADETPEPSSEEISTWLSEASDHDEHRCPVMIQKRLKRERRQTTLAAGRPRGEPELADFMPD